jgi:hypothetical protein
MTPLPYVLVRTGIGAFTFCSIFSRVLQLAKGLPRPENGHDRAARREEHWYRLRGWKKEKDGEKIRNANPLK